MEHPFFDPTELEAEPEEILDALRAQANHAAIEQDWDDYSHLIANLGATLQMTGQNQAALAEYLWLFFVDLNGPSNVAGMPENLRQEFPAFDAGLGFVALDVIEQIKHLLLDLQMNPVELESLFASIVEQRALEVMPVSLATAWQRLIASLQAEDTQAPNHHQVADETPDALEQED